MSVFEYLFLCGMIIFAFFVYFIDVFFVFSVVGSSVGVVVAGVGVGGMCYDSL